MPPFAKNTTHTTQRGPSDATCPGLAALCRLGSESHLGAASTRLRSTRPGGMSVAQAASSIEDTLDLLLEVVSPSFRSSEIPLPCTAFPWFISWSDCCWGLRAAIRRWILALL